METKKIHLLNVPIDNITMQELLDTFNKGLLMTVHTDMMMKLQTDKEFYEILPQFDIITCDSQILYVASKLLGTPLKERVSGSDFFPLYYNKHKDNPNIKIFICGGKPGVPEVAQNKINEKTGRKMVVGVYSPPFDYEKRPEEEIKMADIINRSGATVLLIGLGGGRQEKFIVKNRHLMPNIHTFLPLGGTIDYEAETLKRPNKLITDCGFEWFYRVIKEPKQRWYRYFVQQPPALWLLFKQFLGLYKNPFSTAKNLSRDQEG